MTRLTRLLKTSTFRLSVVYLALFVLSVVTILGYVYLNTSVLIQRQTDETIEAEITGLAEQYRSGGLERLVRTVAERSRSPAGGIYLLTTPGGRPLAGNLPRMPDADQLDSDWVEFDFRSAGDEDAPVRTALARQFRLAGDYRLLVGRDIDSFRNFETLIRSTIVWALGFAVVVGLLGGLLVSRGFLARIEEIARTSQTIVSGDLSQRIALAGSDDEIDRLARSLNDMLDEIERLMAVTRQVTDNVAHDLRTPLARMRVRIEDVLRARQGEAAYRGALELTLEEADRMIATFNALLSIARIESAVGREALGPTDVSAALADALELYEPVAEERDVVVRADIAEDLQVLGDRQLLGQAFANLIDNAIKYAAAGDREASSRPAPEITVLARRAGAGVEVVVADNGAGIDAGDRERVFSRFVRLEQSRTEPGSGLGLALVAAVLRLHSGEISLEDNAPGLRAVISLAPLQSGVPSAPKSL